MMAVKLTAPRRKIRHQSSAGNGVDPYDGPAFWEDPTENVKALSEALSQRQDDLRDLNNQYLDARLNAMEQTAFLRAGHSKDLRLIETELSRMRSDHAREIRHLESDRLEKIRQVDVSNTAITAAQQLAAIQTLAATAASNAEALRGSVGSTAQAIQNQTDRIVGGLVDRIAVLEKTSYTGAGRAGVADPQVERMSSAIEALTRVQAAGTGKSEGISTAWVVLLGAAGLLMTLLGIGGVVFGMTR